MRLLLRLLALAALIALPAMAQNTGLPPIIDRELFFGDPEIAGAQISPDGKFIAFVKPFKGTRNIWVKRTEEPFAAAKPITADTKRPIPGYFWTRDSKFILFVQDKLGDENYNVYAVNPAEAPASGQDVPAARNLTDAKGARAVIYNVPKTDPGSIFVGLNDRDQAWHDLYKVNIATGERTLLRKNTERVTAWVFDLKGQLRLATRAAENGDTEVLRVDADSFKKVYSCGVFETCGPARFHKDGRRVYMRTNKGDAINLIRLVLFDPESGKEELVENDPSDRVDFGGVIFSEVTDEIVATTYTDERLRIVWHNKTWQADYNFLTKQLPGREINPGNTTADESLWLLSAGSDTEPGERYLFDRKTRKLTKQYQVYEKLPRQYLAKMESIRYKSSDGLEIPAYLTLPKGVPPKNLPMVLVPHGGPWGRDAWGYDPMAQFLANRGYAVLQPNFRGSTGYGKKFLNAGNLQWGEKMQDDLTWGVKHLVAQGIADPKRVAIMGGSYGGYATLAGVAFTPDVYAAAVSIVGPSTLITLLDSIPPYWEAIRKLFHERMGDPSTPDGKARLERQSPLNSASKIKTPLLVVQGANDPRVKKAESDQIVIALRDRGFPVEYLVAPDEGHGFARPVNNMAMFALAERFLAKHINGRFQEGATADVSQRLKEITVDPKTVVLAKRIEAASVGIPKPAAALQPGADSFKVTIQRGEQTINLETSTEVREEGDRWVVKDSGKTVGGEMTDVVTLEKGSLAVTRRSIRQGPAAIELDFSGGKATGSMEMGGQKRPIAVDLGGTLFADGAGSYHVLATLPLAEGFKTTFRNFDVQKQKATLKQLEVTGSEQVTVPAGSFDAFKLEITSAEGDPGKTTVWIDKAKRKPVKIVASLPQMGGATLTSELVK
jgi:dipeptidyl aminopeptidase/acylaminoacyl peptidase